MGTRATRAAVVAIVVAAAGLVVWAYRGTSRARTATPSVEPGAPALTVTIDGWGEEGCRCNGWGTLFVRLANTGARELRVLPSYRDGVNVDWWTPGDDARLFRKQFPLVGALTEVSAKTAVTVRVLARKGPSSAWAAQERWLARKPVQGPAELRDPEGTESLWLEPGQSALAMIASRGDWEPIAEVKVEATYDDAGTVRTVESAPVQVHTMQGPAGPIPDQLPGLEWTPVGPSDSYELGTYHADPLEGLLRVHRAPPEHIPEPDRFALPSFLGSYALGYDESQWVLFGEYCGRVSPTNEPYLRHLARYERGEIARRLEAYAEQIHGFPALRSYAALVAAAFGSEHFRRVIENLPSGLTKTSVLLEVASVPVRSDWLCARLVEAAAEQRYGEILDAAIEHECSAIVPIIVDGAHAPRGRFSAAAQHLATWFCAKVLRVGTSCGSSAEPVDDTLRDGKPRLHRPFSTLPTQAPVSEPNRIDRALRAVELARLREKLPAMLAALDSPETLLALADLDAKQARPAIEGRLAAQGGQGASDPAADGDAKKRAFAARYALAKLGPDREQALAALLGEGWLTLVGAGGLMPAFEGPGAPPQSDSDVAALYRKVHAKIVDDLGGGSSAVAADALADAVRGHPAGEVSIAAIRALGQQGPALGVPRLMDLLLAAPVTRDAEATLPPFQCRYRCVPEITRALRRLTGQPFGADTETWRAWWLASGGAAAPRAGIAAGMPAYVRDLVEMLHGTEMGSRVWAAGHLSRLGAKQSANDIAALLKERHEQLQIAATFALARLDAKEHAADIANALGHPYYGVVEPACYALARLDARDHKKPIAAQLTHTWSAGVAAKALALLGAVEYVDQIAKLATSAKSNAVPYTPPSRYGDSPVAPCCTGAASEPPIRGDALIALGILGAKRHAAVAAVHLEGSWRRQAAIALLLMGDQTHAKEVVAILKPNDVAPTDADLTKDLGLHVLVEGRTGQLVARIRAALAQLEGGR